MSYTRMTEGTRNKVYAFKQTEFGLGRGESELGEPRAFEEYGASRLPSAADAGEGRRTRASSRRVVRLYVEERLRAG